MKTQYVFFLLLPAMIWLTACNSTPDAAEQAEDTNEERFEDETEDMAELMVEAYTLNSKIMSLSQLAANNTGIEASIQDLARQLQTDHQGVEQQLSNLASTYNIALPQTITDQNDVESLQAAEPAEFTDDFLEMVDNANENLISKVRELEDEAGEANTDIAGFAQQLLPTLEAHHEQLEQMEDGM